MDILESGETIKSKEKAAIFIQMVKNMMDNGWEIKNQALELINIKMVMYT